MLNRSKSKKDMVEAVIDAVKPDLYPRLIYAELEYLARVKRFDITRFREESFLYSELVAKYLVEKFPHSARYKYKIKERIVVCLEVESELDLDIDRVKRFLRNVYSSFEFMDYFKQDLQLPPMDSISLVELCGKSSQETIKKVYLEKGLEIGSEDRLKSFYYLFRILYERRIRWSLHEKIPESEYPELLEDFIDLRQADFSDFLLSKIGKK
jgi:hypothetical protein